MLRAMLAILCLASVASLSACGLRGPLYLPNPEDTQVRELQIPEAQGEQNQSSAEIPAEAPKSTN